MRRQMRRQPKTSGQVRGDTVQFLVGKSHDSVDAGQNAYKLGVLSRVVVVD